MSEPGAQIGNVSGASPCSASANLFLLFGGRDMGKQHPALTTPAGDPRLGRGLTGMSHTATAVLRYMSCMQAQIGLGERKHALFLDTQSCSLTINPSTHPPYPIHGWYHCDTRQGD